MNDMTNSQRDTLTPKALMFEVAFATAQKLNMSVLENVTDIENDMPVAIVTTQGVNMGIVSKERKTRDKHLTVTYSLNGAVLYTITYPVNENGGTGTGVTQNHIPEDAITYMGW
jgi:hypothetical protein